MGAEAALSRGGAACESRGEPRFARLAKPLRRANVGIRHEVHARVSRRNPRPAAGVAGGRRARQAAQARGANGRACRRSTRRRRRRFSSTTRSGFYHDFSSGKHGDIFAFLMETEGLSFPEAVERLARRWRACRLPRATPRERGAREGARDACTRCWRSPPRFFERDAQRARSAPRRAAISPIAARSRPRSALFGLGYAAARPIRAARRAGGQGRRRGADDRGRAARPRRGHRRALRPVPQPGDVPDPRPRAAGSSPSAAARSIRAPRRNTSTRRRPSFSTRARCCSTITAPARPAHEQRRGDRRSRAMSTSSR